MGSRMLCDLTDFDSAEALRHELSMFDSYISLALSLSLRKDERTEIPAVILQHLVCFACSAVEYHHVLFDLLHGVSLLDAYLSTPIQSQRSCRALLPQLLVWAASYAKLRTLQTALKLLGRRAAVKSHSRLLWQPLWIAVRRKEYGIVKYILDYSPNIFPHACQDSMFEINFLENFILWGRADLVRHLIVSGALFAYNRHERLDLAVSAAINLGATELTKAFLNFDRDNIEGIQSVECPALHIVRQLGCGQAARLLDHVAICSICRSGSWIDYQAAEMLDSEIAEAVDHQHIQAYGFEVTRSQYTIMRWHFAYSKLNLTDKVDKRSRCKIPVVKSFTAQGTSRDATCRGTGSEGQNVLQAAMKRGNTEEIGRLIEEGADINAPASKERGMTLLQEAAIRGNITMVHFLLERRADVNALGAQIDGRTALEGAAEYGRLDVVQLLLNAGADSHKHPRERYLSAIKLAEAECHLAVEELLREQRSQDLEDHSMDDNELLQLDDDQDADSIEDRPVDQYGEDPTAPMQLTILAEPLCPLRLVKRCWCAQRYGRNGAGMGALGNVSLWEKLTRDQWICPAYCNTSSAASEGSKSNEPASNKEIAQWTVTEEPQDMTEDFSLDDWMDLDDLCDDSAPTDDGP